MRIPPPYSDKLDDLIKLMLRPKPEDRPEARAILEMDIMQEPLTDI
jgi:hypothetical protein